MQSNLIIPKDIMVGLQGRSDSLTEKLGFITFHDGKILRQEKTWNNWRDQKQTPLELKNEPTSGFIVSKGVKRYGYYGSGRSVVRIYDPRGFEFEISLDNLVFVLMHSNVSMQDIQEKCVYAWNGKNLVLLPVNSEEYQESIKYTEKQNVKFSAKNLVLGHTYSHKKLEEHYIYIGMQDYFEYNYLRLSKKREHIFYNLKTKKFEPLKMNVLANIVSETDDHSVSDLIDLYKNTKESSPINFLFTKEISQVNYRYGQLTLFKIEDKKISKINISYNNNQIGSIAESIIDYDTLDNLEYIKILNSSYSRYGDINILENHKFYSQLTEMVGSFKSKCYGNYEQKFIKRDLFVNYLIEEGYSNKVFANLKNGQEFVLLKSDY